MAQTGIIIQARMGSSRLPGKVMQDLAGAPVLERLFERLRRVKGAPMIILATSTLPDDDVIADYVSATSDIKLWRGSEQDVLKRYADAARHFDLEPVVRITSDCPLLDPERIEEVLEAFASGDYDYSDNVNPRLFPHGHDVQAVSAAVLDRLDRQASSARDREHVLVHIQDNPGNFRTVHVTPKGEPHPELRITLDYPEDLTLIRAIYERLYPQNPHFDLDDVVDLRRREPGLFELNSMRKIY